MSWGSDTTEGTYTTAYDITTDKMAEQRIDYESPAGHYPSYKIHANVIFFKKTVREVKTHVGLTESAAKSLVDSNNSTTYKIARKSIGSFAVDILFEKTSVRASAQRVDPSGQYHVTIESITVSCPSGDNWTEVSV